MKAENLSVNVLYVLNTITFEWKEITSRVNPSERTDFSWNKVGENQGIIIGGATSPSDFFLDDIWMFDYSCDFNLFESNKKEVSHCFWNKLESKGRSNLLKGKIRGHSSEYIYDLDRIYVFGGIDINKKCSNNLEYYNISSNQWGGLITKGKPPQPRCYHEMVRINNDFLVVYGGIRGELSYFKDILNDVYLYNIRDHVWTEAIIGGVSPNGKLAPCVVKIKNGLTYHNPNSKNQKRYHSKDVTSDIVV